MPDIGSEIVLQAQLHNRAGVLTDPDTIRGWVYPPDAITSIAVSFSKKSTGLYEALFVPTVEGEHWWRIETTGAVKTAEEKKFVVEKQRVPLPRTPQNLFIQKTQPAVADMQENSLWIPLASDGSPLAVDSWEVNTDLGGDGSNLFIQNATPTPVVDALWIKTFPDGSIQYITEWTVFTGLGSDVTNGNRNLYISVAQPTSPLTGSLWIPLNNDLTPKTPDHWMVFA